MKANDVAVVLKDGDDVRTLTTYDEFFRVPHLIINNKPEVMGHHKPDEGHGHVVWGIWQGGTIISLVLDDPALINLVDQRRMNDLPVFSSEDKPYTMPNGESFNEVAS